MIEEARTFRLPHVFSVILCIYPGLNYCYTWVCTVLLQGDDNGLMRDGLYGIIQRWLGYGLQHLVSQCQIWQQPLNLAMNDSLILCLFTGCENSMSDRAEVWWSLRHIFTVYKINFSTLLLNHQPNISLQAWLRSDISVSGSLTHILTDVLLYIDAYNRVSYSMATMHIQTEVKRHGGCLCKKIRYTIVGEPRRFVLCHCSNCKRSGGSAFAHLAIYNNEVIIIQLSHKLS